MGKGREFIGELLLDLQRINIGRLYFLLLRSWPKSKRGAVLSNFPDKGADRPDLRGGWVSPLVVADELKKRESGQWRRQGRDLTRFGSLGWSGGVVPLL